MAILGSLRKNSVVLITVIGMALFAFVISGVFDGKGYVAQDPIGIVNDQDMSIEEFRNQVDFLERSYNLSGMNAVNSVWDQTVRNYILNNQFELSGIDSGKDHLEYILSQNPTYNSDPRFLNDAKLFEIEKFIDLIVELKTTNPDAYEQWKKQESIFQSQSNEKIYFDMISSGINYSFKDGEFEYLLQNDRVDIEYVQIPYSSIPDSLIKLKNSDVEKYIKSNDSDFKIDASRSIDYVLFEEKPSLEDENETKKILEGFLVEKKEYNNVSKQEETIPSLRSAKNLTEFINQNSDIKFDSIYVPKGSLPNNDANILFNLNKNQIYGPYLDDEYFKISRMLDKKKGGNVRASHILISFKGSQDANPEITRSKTEAKKEANRILNLVRKNPDSFSGLAFELSDGPSKSRGGDLGFFQEGAMVKPFNDFVFSKKEGSIGLVETDFGFHIILLEKIRGQEYDVRHILLRPEITDASILEAKKEITEVRERIEAGDLSFAEAAREFSDEEETKFNGGTLINPYTQDSNLELTKMDPELYGQIQDLKDNDISLVLQDQDRVNPIKFKIFEEKTYGISKIIFGKFF